MKTMQQIRAFLESVNYDESWSSAESQGGIFPFVTISRETGAGGHTLGEALLEAMKEDGRRIFQGWQVFDQELCRRVAEEPDLQVSMDSFLRSEYHSQLEDMLSELVAGNSPQDKVVKRIFRVMHMLAPVGKVILVGRGGACLLRELPMGVHVRLVAPLERRIKRMKEILKLDEKKVREVIAEQDKARAQLVKTFFNRNIQDPLLYDVTWNTAEVPAEEIARQMLGLILMRAGTTEKMKLKK